MPTEKAIRHISKNMRASDIKEIIAAGSDSPYNTLKRSVEASKTCSVVSFEGEPLVIVGMNKPNISTGTAVIWLLGTNNSLKFKREFMYYSRMAIDEMLTEAYRLTNYVHIGNKPSVRWLNALGFTLDKPVKLGPYGESFSRFVMERKDV
jgi:hypothetical protein